jgi:mRNA interferase HicA
MKRQRLIRHLQEHHCQIMKEGGDHTWVQNQITGRRSFVPRHREIKPNVVHDICKQLGIPSPHEK